MADFADIIIARLKKASGPDREIDEAITRLLNPNQVTRQIYSGDIINVPRFTASIDATLMLVPPGKGWQVLLIAGGVAAAFVGRGAYQHGATPAIALCIAALKARIVNQSGTDQC